MKQPINGIAGSKPRIGQHDGTNGKIDRAEARALDLEYRKQRNETLRLKNKREELQLRRLDNRWIELDVVHQQVEVLLAAMKARILGIRTGWVQRILGIDDKNKLMLVLSELADELLLVLSRVPEDLQGSNGQAETPSGTMVPEAPSGTVVPDEKLTPTFSKTERARAAAKVRWGKARGRKETTA
jgi:hypothetical protein